MANFSEILDDIRVVAELGEHRVEHGIDDRRGDHALQLVEAFLRLALGARFLAHRLTQLVHELVTAANQLLALLGRQGGESLVVHRLIPGKRHQEEAGLVTLQREPALMRPRGVGGEYLLAPLLDAGDDRVASADEVFRIQCLDYTHFRLFDEEAHRLGEVVALAGGQLDDPRLVRLQEVVHVDPFAGWRPAGGVQLQILLNRRRPTGARFTRDADVEALALDRQPKTDRLNCAVLADEADVRRHLRRRLEAERGGVHPGAQLGERYLGQ